ncbi:MAG: Gfo/Idh/MocA family oxidoreductase [Candidatus Latescibacteria bacterium]|nr:Gfo/Idh/MocA family oxidoreductase [Candidatus Latescibacterota bacterium]
MERNSKIDKRNSERLPRRRNFLKISVLTGAASLSAGLVSPSFAAPVKKNRKLRIGALAVGAHSFWSYTWGDILSPYGTTVNRGSLETDLFNMEITHVWDVNPEEAQKFAAKVGASAVKRYDDMVGKVDAIAFGGYYEVPWQNKLARPYIEAGIPTYLSRPFAYSLRDIDELLDTAAKHSTPIMATDVYEHLYAATTLKKQIRNIGEIECIHGTCLTHEYPALFHTPYLMFKVFGYDIGKVSIITDNPNESTYLVGTYLYKERENQPTFPATLTMTPRGDLYSMTVSGTKGTESSCLPVFENWQDDLLIHHVPMLVAMQRTFEGKLFEPYDNIRKKTELFLSGFYSASERDGAPVDVGTVPTGWRALPIKPDWIDEAMFK